VIALDEFIVRISGVIEKWLKGLWFGVLANKQGYYTWYKNFKKTACEIFHDAASSHALRFKSVSNYKGLVSLAAEILHKCNEFEPFYFVPSW
jgi:hypothetical protein